MRSGLLALCFLSLAGSGFGQHVVVTAEGRHGQPPPEVSADEVAVEVNGKAAPVKAWLPLRGEDAGLELYVVIDDGSDADLANQYSGLKSFVSGLVNAKTRVGLAYLRNGSAMVAAAPTSDATQFAKALRLPLAQPGIASSPYMGISDLLKKWPAAEARREVLLISSGADPWSPRDPQNPYLTKAIADAQRAGVLVHSIYYAGAGHGGHSYSLFNWGQNFLSEMADGTGGEAYWQGYGSPVSLEPFLKDLAQRLGNQYLLTVEQSSGELQPLKVTSSKAGLSLVAATRIRLPK